MQKCLGMDDLNVQQKGKIIKYFRAEESEIAIAVIAFAIWVPSTSQDFKTTYEPWVRMYPELHTKDKRETCEFMFVEFPAIHFLDSM